MPSKWRVRRIFGPLVNVLARGMGKLGLSPNGATWIMLGTAIASSIVLNLTRWELLFGILVFFIGIMDGVDGSIARQFHKASKMGEFFDSFADRLSEIILSLGFLFYFTGYTGNKTFPFPAWGISIESWIAWMIMGSMLVSYVRARAELIVKGDFDKGLFARSERLFTLFFFSLFALLPWGIVVVTIGANITAFYRLTQYRKMLKISGPITPPPPLAEVE
ncbi:MAG: CDP-alcohol phosphatidyltransferase [Promethearchaeota archaeon CR_4]|nr:MAG: CDP-alcohol phosphatidyltransferase [Candidatus Lokiarchaeota archaeon CR_4]